MQAGNGREPTPNEGVRTMKRSKTIRTLATVATAAALAALAPHAADAQMQIAAELDVDEAPALRGAQSGIWLGPEIAFNDDADFGIGIGLEFDLPSIDPNLSYMGDFVFFFPDGFDYFEFNANLAYDLPLEDASVTPFLLSGLNVGRVSGEGESDFSDTEVGLNVGAGVKFNAGTVSPRVTGRFNLFSSESFTLTAFVPFRVGN
jgi:opacity protein-like surface antigen